MYVHVNIMGYITFKLIQQFLYIYYVSTCTDLYV